MKHLTRITALFASCLLLSSMCVPAAVSAEDEPAIDNYSYGDVNLDEKIDVSDAVLLARYAAEDRTAAITSRGKQLADVNRDGDLTSDDTLQILEYISKKRAVLGTEQPPQPVGKTICLTENISAEDAAGKSADAAFISSQLGFAANLLRETDLDDSANRQENEKQKNLLISPLSVSLALGMTANGAKGETLAEMEKVLGGDLDMVKAFIARAASFCHVELTTLVIPGENDSEEEMRRLSDWVADTCGEETPLHISRFFPRFHMTDRGPTDVRLIYHLAEVARENLRYVYTGNC